MNLLTKIINKEKITQEDYISIMKAAFDRIEIPTDADKIEFHNAVHGGKCFYCKKDWIKRSINSAVGEYEYYKPECECLDMKIKDNKFEIIEKRIEESCEIPEKYYGCTIRKMDLDINKKTLAGIEKVKNYVNGSLYIVSGLILYGDVGAGKTHMAVSVLKAICIKQKKSGLFVHASDFISSEISSKKNYVSNILERDIILLDDMDKATIGKTESEWISERFFSLINGINSGKKILIATSNLKSTDDFYKLYERSIISRLIESCIFVKIQGDDYRLKRS